MTARGRRRLQIGAFLFFLIGSVGTFAILIPGRASEEADYETATMTPAELELRSVSCKKGHGALTACDFTFAVPGMTDHIVKLDAKLADRWKPGDHVRAQVYGNRIGTVEIDGVMTRPIGNPGQALTFLIPIAIVELAIAVALGVSLWRKRRVAVA